MTAEKIVSKIDTEYELFYMDMIKTSRENLFAKSGEIEKKKQIVIYMKKKILEEKDICFNRMLTENNLMDSLYRYSIDHPEKEIDQAVEEFLEKYKKEN